MRTRFLPTDYSAIASGACGGPLGALGFIYLPLPNLPAPDHPSFASDFEQSFVYVPVLGISREIDKLPIDDALSVFLLDVLPHFIDGSGFEEKQEVIHSEEKDGTTSTNNVGNRLKFVQFEAPEMDITLLSPKGTRRSQCSFLHILYETPQAEAAMDQLNSDLMLWDHAEIEQLVYSVDVMDVEYSVNEKTDILLEEADFFPGEPKSHDIRFPLFEVDVENLHFLERTYTMEKNLIFETVKMQQVVQSDEIIRNNKELLGSMEFDLIKYLFHLPEPAQCLEDSKFADHIGIIELPHCHEYSTQCLGEPDSIQSMNPVIFDEYSFFDLKPYLFNEMSSDLAKVIEVEPRESLFGEAMNFKSFGELIVCHELTLIDDSFIALPAPILSDDGFNYSFHKLVEELFARLEWQSSSVSDNLYLDWCFLEGDCESDKYSSCQKMMWEIDTCDTDVAMYTCDSEQLIFDFITSEGHSLNSNAGNCKRASYLSCSDVPVLDSTANMDLSSLRNHGDGKTLKVDVSVKAGVENVSVFGESMSSDLEFFLNPRNCLAGRESKPAYKNDDPNIGHQVLKSTNNSAAPNSTAGIEQQWNVRIHQICLSDTIILLIDNLLKEFLALLENDEKFVHLRNQYLASNDLKILYIPSEKLMQCIQEKLASSTYLAYNDERIMVLAMLFAIKQMTFCLSFYGIQAAYLYIDRLISNLRWVRSRFSSLYNLIRNANQKAEKELNVVHPCISVVHKILQEELSNSNSKVLIICDQVIWDPVKRLLTLLKKSFNEPQQLSGPSCCSFQITDIMLNSDCCLVPHEYVSASFPFSKFNFILEYGGPNVSSRISSICPKSKSLPTLYFLKVELEGSNVAKALSFGINMLPKSSNWEKNLDSASAAQKENRATLGELLSTIPIKYGKLVEAGQKYEECNIIPVQPVPVDLEEKENLLCKPFAKPVIIVNTQNFNEEMIISRSSTYQRILEIEQEGAQVIERDIALPIDLVLNSAVCLTWYDCRNIRKKASAPDEAFSSLALCIESIAASILTSLSFAFSCCIMIFEGECSFICSIMESSDELYAAAASLRIDLQIFFTYSSDMTEEIILSCIKVAAESTRGLYPRMSDSESLAESFLTSFPSINPLSAHAIMSSGALLGKFLELTNVDRICALQNYKVPEESIALMSVVSRYGEREDSKSGVTDCSSSRSVPDSENVQFKCTSERMKLDYTHARYSAGSAEIPNRLRQFNLSEDEKLLINRHGVDVTLTESVDMSRQYDLPLAKGLQFTNERENPWMLEIDSDCRPSWTTTMTPWTNFDGQSSKICGLPEENITGEVIDTGDTTTFWEDLYASHSASFLDIEKDYSARNLRMSKQPFVATNVDSTSGALDSTSQKRQLLRKESKSQSDNIYKNNIPVMCQRVLTEGDMSKRVPQSCYNLSLQEKGRVNLGDTPLSNALRSTQVQQGSPWTIEFLNRIREKSRLRHQSASYELSPQCLDSSGNTSKIIKRKSPSILEFYKYERGSTPQKPSERKRPKRSSQSEKSLKNKKDSASYPSLWTPVDKRARQTLSFSTNGSGGQSKLVWRDTSQRRL